MTVKVNSPEKIAVTDQDFSALYQVAVATKALYGSPLAGPTT